jgi:hypothetical protein
MNLKPEPANDDVLQQKLQTWVVNTPLPPRFEEQVWQRIARAEARPEATLRDTIVRLFELVLVRPRVAYAYIAVLLALGMGAGSWAAQRENSRLDVTLGSRYVRSLDPYQHP